MANITDYMHELGINARQAAQALVKATTAQKNKALQCIAGQLADAKETIQQANQQDLINGKKNGLSSALLDRLELTDARLEGMITGVKQVIALADPVGAIRDLKYTSSGLQIGKMRTPIGVIGMIYESRPNVTIDAAALCLKSGNAIILRGGSEAIHSNKAIAACIQQGLQQANLPAHCVQLVNTTDRQAVDLLITMPEYVDVIIPRGGKSLIQRISEHAKVPVIKHLDGVCHIYVDQYADLAKACKVAVNAKCYRYGICGAMETLLVDQAVAEKFLPIVAQQFIEKGVELRGCERTLSYLPTINKATEEDWFTEYLAAILAVRVVDNIEQAISHINYYGSHHTDSIITENTESVRRFLAEVDSSSVMHNTPTCFADGFEYGLGAEIGISTDKLHVRGPVGLEGLTTEKYIVLGDGQTRG
ncbi:glutamate-5-semialdehyde dehydrogenase [Entomomonas asaccharolytica]